jgi:leader peptidase (prepilin peptidase)/N-methyltransferase
MFPILGLLIGSFLNVVILRTPKDESIVFPASHCVHCKTPLKWYHLVPVFSWLFLRGKCGYCKAAISIQYPLVELAVGIIFFTVFMHSSSLIEALFIALSFALLLALSIIDYRYLMVSDSINLTALVFAIIGANIFVSLEYALLFAGAFALLRFFVSYFKGQEAMGEADIIVAATIGAVLGPKLGAFTIFVSALLGLIAFIFMRDKAEEIPYIPYLAGALFLVYIFQDAATTFLGYLYP